MYMVDDETPRPFDPTSRTRWVSTERDPSWSHPQPQTDPVPPGEFADIQREQEDGYRLAAQQVRDTIDPAALAAHAAALTTHQQATAAFEAARQALVNHGEKPPRFRLGGNDAWYTKRDDLARRVDHLLFDRDETAQALAAHAQIVSALALHEAHNGIAAIVAQEPGVHATYQADIAAARAKLGQYNTMRAAWSKLVDHLTRGGTL
jgi:hypothetical protein